MWPWGCRGVNHGERVGREMGKLGAEEGKINDLCFSDHPPPKLAVELRWVPGGQQGIGEASMQAAALTPDGRRVAGWARLAVWSGGGDLEVEAGWMSEHRVHICLRVAPTASLVGAVSRGHAEGWGRGL